MTGVVEKLKFKWRSDWSLRISRENQKLQTFPTKDFSLLQMDMHTYTFKPIQDELLVSTLRKNDWIKVCLKIKRIFFLTSLCPINRNRENSLRFSWKSFIRKSLQNYVFLTSSFVILRLTFHLFFRFSFLKALRVKFLAREKNENENERWRRLRRIDNKYKKSFSSVKMFYENC